MTITVTHSTPADGSFSASGATAWNASHTLSGTIDIANGGTGQATSTAAINALLPTQATNSGKYLTTDGTNTSWATAGGSPGGSTTQVQFNSSGSFGGSANFTWDGTNAQLGATGALRFADTDSSNYVAFKSPATVASNVTWTLPATDGTAGQVLKTDGTGNLSWTSTLPASGPTSVEYLVVAGGGGGGTYQSGGGGAGGLLTTTGYTTAVGTSYTVTVGAGAAAKSSTIAIGNSGSNSVFGTGTVTNSAATSGSITSVGGGGGATGGGNAGSATTGGSGGGGGSNSGSTAGAAGTSGQGNSGGNSPGATGNYPSGGGGGAGAVGGSPATGTSPAGNGGAGITYTTGTSITGLAESYAGGGGAGVGSSGTAGTGGTGGGGNGSSYAAGGLTFTGGSAGTVNTGGASGGGGVNSASVGTSFGGGSGVVIIAYPSTFADLAFVAATLTSQSWNGSAWVNNASGSTTPNTTIRSGYKVYRFSAGTGAIYW